MPIIDKSCWGRGFRWETRERETREREKAKRKEGKQ